MLRKNTRKIKHKKDGIFRKTFKVNYFGHNNKKLHISLHVKDINQANNMINFFNRIGFKTKMPKILKTNKYPVTHWMLFPNKNYYCNDCFYISIIIYKSDVNYKSSLKRFKQSYGKTIKERSKKKIPPHISISTKNIKIWNKIINIIENTDYPYTKIYKPDESTINILLPNGSVFEISNPKLIYKMYKNI